jgi:hypothetical protein
MRSRPVPDGPVGNWLKYAGTDTIAGALDVSARSGGTTARSHPNAVFPPLRAAYPAFGHGRVNDLAVLRGDVRARVGAEGAGGGLSA